MCKTSVSEQGGEHSTLYQEHIRGNRRWTADDNIDIRFTLALFTLAPFTLADCQRERGGVG